MKYEKGDKVKIKTWERMEKEFVVGSDGIIECCCYLTPVMEIFLKKLNNGRVLTVKSTVEEHKCYYVEEIRYTHWSDDMIDRLDENYIKQNFITSRFEILDL